ncbi:unnamed protein product, partial [Polarella glacialis]
ASPPRVAALKPADTGEERQPPIGEAPTSDLQKPLGGDAGDSFKASAESSLGASRGPGRAAAAADPRKPRDFEALQQELLADERAAPASPVSQGEGELAEDGGVISDGTEGSDDDDAEDIQLGEVRASETGTAVQFTSPRRFQQRQRPEVDVAPSLEGNSAGSRTRRREVLLFIGPPPPQPASTGAAGCFVLVGGLPWWLTDVELRRHGEQFGGIRSIRVLDHPGSGKSAGIALLEYALVEAGLARPRLVLVSNELFAKLRSGMLPWPDGGPCDEELRAILLRQFDASSNSQRSPAYDSPPRGKGRKGEGRRGDGGKGRGPQDFTMPGPPSGPPPSANRQEDTGNWADKLKKLKLNVNSRQDLGSVSEPQEPSRKVPRR